MEDEQTVASFVVVVASSAAGDLALAFFALY